jgi:hypothetical protein
MGKRGPVKMLDAELKIGLTRDEDRDLRRLAKLRGLDRSRLVRSLIVPIVRELLAAANGPNRIGASGEPRPGPLIDV